MAVRRDLEVIGANELEGVLSEARNKSKPPYIGVALGFIARVGSGPITALDGITGELLVCPNAMARREQLCPG
jgi:hypothetical protein